MFITEDNNTYRILESLGVSVVEVILTQVDNLNGYVELTQQELENMLEELKKAKGDV